ncbi:hypothetical protein PMI04_004000 [Sphingobium sp. AP49]|uniref:hypothetical protein n=1 Tax=Sphingobium sp. AP49 TaxID=1144307 RepID=UPI0002FE4893|nr:hypothetical protein [Sphingobium sp. AP49]WHO41099.1 hypothetical protein PMI04_004000 [Sphingobium sp. AP49]
MRWLSSLFFILLGLPTPAQAQAILPVDGSALPGPTAMEGYRAKTAAIRPCDRSGGGIVVCGNRAERNAKERLPLPRVPEEGGRTNGDTPRASAAPARQGACGVVGGQGVGCVGGGVPILGAAMLAGKIVAHLIDPDADLAPPPPPLPDQVPGAGQH